jgi:hypothetical protein
MTGDGDLDGDGDTRVRDEPLPDAIGGVGDLGRVIGLNLDGPGERVGEGSAVFVESEPLLI